jgi:hypothetical protein
MITDVGVSCIGFDVMLLMFLDKLYNLCYFDWDFVYDFVYDLFYMIDIIYAFHLLLCLFRVYFISRLMILNKLMNSI